MRAPARRRAAGRGRASRTHVRVHARKAFSLDAVDHLWTPQTGPSQGNGVAVSSSRVHIGFGVRNYGGTRFRYSTCVSGPVLSSRPRGPLGILIGY